MTDIRTAKPTDISGVGSYGSAGVAVEEKSEGDALDAVVSEHQQGPNGRSRSGSHWLSCEDSTTDTRAIN
jgi:hypothetical protein